MKIIRVSFVLFFVLTLCVPNSTRTHQSAEDRTGKIMTKIVVGTVFFIHAALPQDIRANLAPVHPTVGFGVGITCLMSAGYDLIKLWLPRPMRDNQTAYMSKN